MPLGPGIHGIKAGFILKIFCRSGVVAVEEVFDFFSTHSFLFFGFSFVLLDFWRGQGSLGPFFYPISTNRRTKTGSRDFAPVSGPIQEGRTDSFDRQFFFSALDAASSRGTRFVGGGSGTMGWDCG